jgi:hypothetical protein
MGKGWFGRSLEEMNAIVAPFRYQPQEKNSYAPSKTKKVHQSSTVQVL